ncbi:MAG: DNA gyrase subunit A [Gammaproteobacteria bacterium]|nr:DNA gyrase subunit A [Gammaproteobacteria bacterium]
MSDDDSSTTPEDESNNNDELSSSPPSSTGGDIVRVYIEDEMRHSYLGYAMSVIIGRALPDIRDGLKPVHRRCLFGMDQLNNRHDRPTMKSARVGGEVVGKYHPHGEQAIYETIVNMAQDFKMRYPLVEGQGNFGSIDGDPAAAPRYTEVRMMRIASMMLADLDRETVDMTLNYDDTILVPVVLPTRIPNLLINGSYGIAVAMATNIPPHNLTEVIDACIALVDDEHLTVEDLMQYVQGPDFPTAGIINGRAGIVQSYKTGRGRIRVRARASIEKEKSGRETIIVTEIPFQQNKAKLVESIADLVREKRISGISDLRDESSKNGMRIVIEVSRGEPGDVVLNNLFAHTQLESSVSVNCTALVGGQPRTVNLKDMLMAFIHHRREVVIRRSTYLLRESRRRAHTLEGQAVALADIDEIVELIRSSESRQDAQDALTGRSWLRVVAGEDDSSDRISRVSAVQALLRRADVKLARRDDLDASLGFDEETGEYRLSNDQADAILSLQLHRLVSLEQNRLISEYEELIAVIKSLQEILESDKRMNEVVKEELIEVRDEFGDERKTEILQTEEDFTTIDMIVPKTVVVTISHGGYAKSQPIDVYEAQRRGGRGKTAATVKEDDFVEHLLITHNHSTLLCFSNRGRAYWLPTYQIPESSRNALGRPLVNLLELEGDERISAICPVKDFSEDRFVVLATRRGQVKRVELSKFSRPRKRGLIAIGLLDNDRLIGADLTDGHQEIVLVQNKGLAVKFMESDVRVMGRTARGVRGIRLRGDAEVLSLVIPHENGYLLCATENGYGKRTDLQAFRRTGRGGLGSYAIRSSQRNGEVAGAVQVFDTDHVMFINNRGTLIRTSVDQIRIAGRNTQGVRLIRLGEEERLIGIGRIPESALSEEEETQSDSSIDETPDNRGESDNDSQPDNSNNDA